MYKEIGRRVVKSGFGSKARDVEKVSFEARGSFEEIQQYLKPCEYDMAVIGINENGEIIIKQNVSAPSRAGIVFPISTTTVNPYGTLIPVVNIREMTLEVVQEFTSDRNITPLDRRKQGIEATKKDIVILQCFDNNVHYDDKKLYGEFSVFIKNSGGIVEDTVITNEQFDALKKIVELNNLCKFSLTTGPLTVLLKVDSFAIIDKINSLLNPNSIEAEIPKGIHRK